MGLEGREGLEGLVRQVGSACGQASSRLRISEDRVGERGWGPAREQPEAESLRSRPRISEDRAGERGWGPARGKE